MFEWLLKQTSDLEVFTIRISSNCGTTSLTLLVKNGKTSLLTLRFIITWTLTMLLTFGFSITSSSPTLTQMLKNGWMPGTLIICKFVEREREVHTTYFCSAWFKMVLRGFNNSWMSQWMRRWMILPHTALTGRLLMTLRSWTIFCRRTLKNGRKITHSPLFLHQACSRMLNVSPQAPHSHPLICIQGVWIFKD